MSIAESDWKTFKEVRENALERLSQRILGEARAICDDESMTAHERYGRLYGLIRERDRDMAYAFNDFRRSTAVRCLCLMLDLDLMTDEEIARFSDDVQRTLRL